VLRFYITFLTLLGIAIPAILEADPPPLDPTKPHYRWTQIDLSADGSSQGDAHLIQGSNGKSILIDCGTEQHGHKILVPYLREQGVKELEALFITHPHFDHYGGAIPLLQSGIVVHRIYFNPITIESIRKEEPWGVKEEDVRKIYQLAAAKQVPVLPYEQFDRYVFDENTYLEKLIVFTEEELKAKGIRSTLNDLSLIANFQHHLLRTLFTGDLDLPLSNWLVANHPQRLACTLLKVPHHGAEGVACNTFFKLAAPQVALIPTPLWLWEDPRSKRDRDQLTSQNIPIYSSALHGHVTVHFQEGHYWITSSKRPEPPPTATKPWTTPDFPGAVR